MQIQKDQKLYLPLKHLSVYRSDMSNEELLTGVTATDRKDGDVSSSLTVESVYEIDDSHVAVTYTAKRQFQ